MIGSSAAFPPSLAGSFHWGGRRFMLVATDKVHVRVECDAVPVADLTLDTDGCWQAVLHPGRDRIGLEISAHEISRSVSQVLPWGGGADASKVSTASLSGRGDLFGGALPLCRVTTVAA